MERLKSSILLTALCFLLPALLSGQVDTAWIRRYDDPVSGDDMVWTLATDGRGNVYVAGHCTGISYTCDFLAIKYKLCWGSAIGCNIQ